jgi:hypothetical protein
LIRETMTTPVLSGIFVAVVVLGGVAPARRWRRRSRY